MVRDSCLRTWSERQGHSPPPDQLIRTRKKPFAPSPPSSITSGSPTPPGERPHILPDKEVIIESKHAGNTKLTRQGSHTSQESLNIYNTPTLAKLAHNNKSKSPAPEPPTSSSPGNSSGNRSRRDFVETESLDSFTLEHPRGSAPKPPATYFDGATRGATYVDGAPRGRQVLVSIGSYGDTRPAPSRLPFLSSSSRHTSTDETDSVDNDGGIGATQLQNELVATLSRARLSQDSEGGATQRNELQLSGSDTSADSSPGGGILKQEQ